MDKEEYIQYLVDKGLSSDEIMAMLDKVEDPDNAPKENTTDLPKKKQDPVKSETSSGSFLDMVSKSESGSSDLPDWYKEPSDEQLPDFVKEDKRRKYQAKIEDILGRKTKVDYTIEGAAAKKIQEDIDNSEALREQQARNAKIVFDRFTVKPREVTEISSSITNTRLGTSIKTKKKLKNKMSDEAIDMLKEAKLDLMKDNKGKPPSQDEITQRAKEMMLNELDEKSRNEEFKKIAESMEGDEVTQFANLWLSSVTQGASGVDVIEKSGERADFAKSLESANIKQKQVAQAAKDIERAMRNISSQEVEIEKIRKKNGKDTSKWSKEDVDIYNNLVTGYKKNIKSLQQNAFEWQADIENYKDLTEEIDIFKKEYGLIVEAATNLRASVLDLEGGALYALEMAGDILTEAATIGYADTRDKSLFAYVGDLAFEESKAIRSTVDDPVKLENVNTFDDFIDFAANGLANNAPQLAVTLATGGGYAGLTAVSSIAAGSQYKESLKFKDTNQFNRFITSIGIGAIEFASERVTQKIFAGNMPGSRVVRSGFSSLKQEAKNEALNVFTRSLNNAIKKTPKFIAANSVATIEESLSEGLAQIGGNAMNRYVLGDKSVSIMDGVAESAIMGGIIGAGISLTPSIAQYAVAPFVSNSNNTLQKNIDLINKLRSQLVETQDIRIAEQIDKKIKSLEDENASIVLDGVRATYGLTASEINEAHQIHDEMADARTMFNDITSDNSISSDQKQMLLDQLSENYKDLQKRKSDLIQKGNRVVDSVTAYSKKINAVKNLLSQFDSKIEFIVAKDAAEAKQYADKYRSEDTESALEEDGYIIRNSTTGEQTIIINEQVALAREAVNVAGHELLHGILFASVRNNLGDAQLKGLSDALLGELKKIDPKSLEEGEFKERLEFYQKDENLRSGINEETLTLFFDAYSKGLINLNEGSMQNVKDGFRRVFQRAGFGKIEFNSGQDVINFIKDFDNSVNRGRLTKAQERLAKEGAKGDLAKTQAQMTVEKGTETETARVAASTAKVRSSKSTVLEEINDLIPEGIETKEQFLSDRSFTDVYNSLMMPGGAINNYVKSRTTSAMEAELAIDSVLDRLMNFDPQAKRKDGSTIGREGFGEFIFANTAFGKLDAKKKLYEESQRKAKETTIDESTKQIADVETEIEVDEQTAKEKPSIDPLKLIGVPEVILSDKPGEGLTFKKVGSQYAGEVGEQILGIPAKKITDASANLGSVNEARAIQQFFFKGDNLEKFVKILPGYSFVPTETKIGTEKLDVPKDVFGTGLGMPKRVIDYFYEPFTDVTGKLTSPKGRTKGLTSQTPAKRLKPEFRGVISTETINKLKLDLGITPKGELNILPKGELRSPIGQLLKGVAKTYSTLAANRAVRLEMEKAGAPKEAITKVASGKRDVMASKGTSKPKITNIKNIDVDAIIALSGVASVNDAAKYLGIKNKITVDENNREQKLKEANDLIEKGKITTAQLEAVKLFNFGRLYERRDGIKYYKTKDGSFVKAGSKEYTNAERQGLFVAARGSLYYGKSDPAYRLAFELAQKNDSDLKIPKAKRVSAKDAFSEKANDQFSINMDVLEGLIESLANAVHIYGLPIETAALFITSSYQATTGLIKISGKFKYESNNAKYAGPLGKPNQNSGETFIEEHSVPASTIGAVLMYAISENASKPVMQLVRKSFIQVKLGKQYDMLVDKAGLAAKLPDGFSIIDNNALRYIMAGIITKDMPGMPSMDMNAQVDPTTGKTWAQELGIDLPLEYRTKDNLDLQNELLLDLLTNGGKYNNHQQYLNEAIKLDNTKAATPNNKIATNAGVMASKSNKQVVNNLNNYDKALRNARNPNAPTKGITVFDFDDTLAISNSLVGVTMPDGDSFKIDATEFAQRGDALLAQGAEFDFSDFSKVVDGKPGPLISKLEKAIEKFGNKDIYVLTARPVNSALAIYEFLKSIGYEIPLENITGLQNSSPEAKAQWMVNKAAEGYNDFYFVDDAYKNVKAVQDAMSVLDVKSKERIAYKDRFEKLDKEFNDIIENKTGIASEKEYSDAKAEVVGVDKGRFNFFISPSAEDFVGLLYSTLGKGKLGENQMAWYKKNLLDPYTRAMNNIASERMTLAADYKALKKQLGVVPNKLKNKIKGEGFTQEQAVRIYIWNKQGMDVPGLSKTDLAEMTKYVENNPKLNVFADQLIEITKGDGYAMPFENWMTGSITTDLLSTLQITKRAKHLEEWQRNVDVIFSNKNLNKLEAAYGSTYRKAMDNILQRMKTGKNRGYDTDSLTGRFLDWINGSTGAIMFFNTRSAILQTISAVNFINWSDNNIFKASAAFANQPQYWKDFKELFMSDFLKERRDNLTININESDIAEMANKGGVRGAIGYILQKGFLPTQFADGFAIASGGATFYRNRINTYIKEGLSEKEAKEKAFNDFRELTEESQQSSRPDRISQQQAGPLGRIVLAFANTPSQYARIIKKATLDLKNNRGDWKTNLSKIMYYSVVQGFIFNALQSALFAADFDDEEEMEEKMFKMGNSITDGILRGMGVQGAITSVVKNTTLKALEESEKDRPKYDKVVNEILRISPPVSSKISKLQQAAREVEWNKKEMKSMGWSLENPAWIASANVLSATTNIPADRVIKKINNITYASTQDIELYERLALLGGWQKWELGLAQKEKTKKQAEEKAAKKKAEEDRKRGIIRLKNNSDDRIKLKSKSKIKLK